MRTITLKGLFLTVLFVLFGSLAIQAADDGLITQQTTIKLNKAGTLPDRIGENQKYLITNLKIVGEINGTDLRFIREMAGWDYDKNKTDGKLSILDLSDAKIVEGGFSYFLDYDFDYEPQYASNDKLGDCVFSGCSGLISLTIPSGVTEIGEEAFRGCSGLTSLTLPSGVARIGKSAFEGCNGLTSLTIPSGVTSIEDRVFSGCRGLTNLTISSYVNRIGEAAFRDCSGLTNLTIPSWITSIGEEAFRGCSGLTSLTIPSSSWVTSIRKGTFRDCSGLTSLTIPSGVTEIGEEAFRGCSGLTSLTIPSWVTRIDDYAFSGCSGLTILTILSSATDIGSFAFEDCSRLTSIYVYPEECPSVMVFAFNGCDAKNCTVYVPTGTYDYYRSSEFGYFKKIVEFDAAGIDKVTTSTDAKEVSRYSVNGQRLSAPVKGLNIVKYSDGSVKKVAVQ